MTIDCAGRWRAEWIRREEGLREISSWDPFRDWNRNRMPESSVEDELRVSLVPLLGRGDVALAELFLRRALAIADRAIAEKRLQDELCRFSFPHNRSRLTRARSYAACLLDVSLDEAALSQASRDNYAWAMMPEQPCWDSQIQAYATAAIRLALVAGDQALAAEQLGTRKSFKWHSQEHAILKRIATAAPATLARDDLAALDAYFDVIRDPGFKADVYHETHIVRLEMSIIRYRYFVSKDGSIDWNRVLEQIRA